MAFARAGVGRIAATLGEHEVHILRGIADEMVGVVAEPTEATVRLFPPAYADDVDRERGFVELTRDELVAAKVEACRRVLDTLERGEVKRRTWRATLDPEDTAAWLGMLNDARLVLGTRLQVAEGMDHRLHEPGETDAHAHNLYLYLGSLQEALVEVLDPGGAVPDDDDPR